MKNISIWNKIYKNELFRPQYPNQNAEYFYLYHISKKKKSKLLDLGCGNFVNSKYFLEKKISVYSADFSYEALKSIITGWSDIKDEEDNDIPFSQKNLKDFSEDVDFVQGVVKAFQTFYATADEKN